MSACVESAAVTIGTHLRHMPTGRVGRLMGVRRVGEVVHYLVVVDGSGGHWWMDYAAGEWEVVSG